MKCAGDTKPRHPVIPAHQRLCTGAAALAVNLHLVVQHKLVALQAQPDLFGQLGVCGNRRLHHRIEESRGVATGRLAWYMATSAFLSRSSMVSWSSIKTTMPMLGVLL